MMKYTKSNSGHLHCYALGQGSVLVSYLPHCFRIFPLYSVLKTVAIVILWKCFWILSFFCLKASSNFSSWGECQALQNQQNVRYSLGFVVFFFYLSHPFCILLHSQPVLVFDSLDVGLQFFMFACCYYWQKMFFPHNKHNSFS